jgi:hypothetical protein
MIIEIRFEVCKNFKGYGVLGSADINVWGDRELLGSVEIFEISPHLVFNQDSNSTSGIQDFTDKLQKILENTISDKNQINTICEEVFKDVEKNIGGKGKPRDRESNTSGNKSRLVIAVRFFND